MAPSANCGTSRANSYILCSDRPGKLTSAASPSRYSLRCTPPTSRLWRGQRYAACTITVVPASCRSLSNPSRSLESICRRPQQRQLNSFREKFGLKSPILHISLRVKLCRDRLAARKIRTKECCHKSECYKSRYRVCAEKAASASRAVTFSCFAHLMSGFIWVEERDFYGRKSRKRDRKS